MTGPECGAWNDAHTCGRPPDHPGDHVCRGCRDRWNRGPWDDDADEWAHERPNPVDRCGVFECVECGMTAGEMSAAEQWANVPPGTGACCEVPLTADGR